MTDTHNNPNCALHNTSLPNLKVERTEIYDQVGNRARRTPHGVIEPETFVVLEIDGFRYGMWRTSDRQVHLILHTTEGRTGMSLRAQQGQKVRISQDYWIVNAPHGERPTLVDC